MGGKLIRVGGRAVPIAIAEAWVASYFDADVNQVIEEPWAYPFYDRMDTRTGPNELDDGDLIAPLLLNAGPRIRGFRSLQRMRPALEQGLAAIPLDLALETAVADGTHAELLAGLAGVLDTPDPKLRAGVQGTILMKVLHRKRPLFAPLYDDNILECYRGPATDGYPIARDTKRSWSQFFALLAEAMVHDLTAQHEQWGHLSRLVPDDVAPLRLLDVVAWNAGQQSG